MEQHNTLNLQQLNFVHNPLTLTNHKRCHTVQSVYLLLLTKVNTSLQVQTFIQID